MAAARDISEDTRPSAGGSTSPSPDGTANQEPPSPAATPEKVNGTDTAATTVEGAKPAPDASKDSLSDIKELLQKLSQAVKEQEVKSGSTLAKGSLPEIKSLVQRLNNDGQNEVIEKDTYLSSADKKEYAQYALVAKQMFDDRGKLEKTVVEINSPQLLGALKQTVRYYPSEPLQFEKQAAFDSPFMLLNHYSDELQKHVEDSDDETLKAHTKLLLHFLENEAGERGTKAKSLATDGLVSFEMLWTVFRPGDLLYAQEYGHERLYRLQKADYVDSGCSRGMFFELACEYTSCDGVRSGTSSTKINIWEKEEFVGISPSKITSLSISPLKAMVQERQDTLKETLTKRGERYLEILGVQTFDYNGLFMYLKQPPYDYYDERAMYDGTWLPRSGVSRIVVDAKTFVEELKNQEERNSGRRMGDDEVLGTRSGRENYLYQSLDVDPLFCPPYVYGHSLDMQKEWCKFFVNNLRPVEWKQKSMQTLILPDMQRRLIQSLVSSHRFPDQARNEENLKGKGLIILLHGTPGSGKTMTAEMVAEHTKRPLLKISTGELGAWGERISHELKKLLTYASIWHAIVLIDEADVFLEARQSGPEQFEQNNLVAVFLRQLEYFQGILFLTSNRIQVFDAAIRSRIHLAIEYHAPDQERRRLLWQQNLDLVPAAELDLNIKDSLSQLDKAEMNGREISNAVNTARTLATGEGKEEGRLGMEHLETVLHVWTSFQESLDRIQEESRKGAKAYTS